jgi:hypothetical protein
MDGMAIRKIATNTIRITIETINHSISPCTPFILIICKDVSKKLSGGKRDQLFDYILDKIYADNV